MILLPGLIGAVIGLGTVWAMWQSRMLAERSGAAVLLCAIAFFYPVFAVMVFTGHPGPVWWPAFCGSLDIAAGLTILVLLRTNRITT